MMNLVNYIITKAPAGPTTEREFARSANHSVWCDAIKEFDSKGPGSRLSADSQMAFGMPAYRQLAEDNATLEVTARIDPAGGASGS